MGRVLGLFGPFTDFKRFYNFSERAHLDTTSIRRVSSHFSNSLDDRDVKLTVAVYTITMDFILFGKLDDVFGQLSFVAVFIV